MMKRVKIFCFGMMLCALGFFMSVGAALAAPLPLVDYSSGLAIVSDANGQQDIQTSLLSGPDGEQLGRELDSAIVRRLEELDREGKLPFRLRHASNANRDAAIDTSVHVAIKPLCSIATDFDFDYMYRGQSFYRAFLIGGLDLVFIVKEGDDRPRFLGTVPIWVQCDTINQTPNCSVPRAEKLQIFREAMLKEIANLDFNKARKALRGLEAKAVKMDGTGQVTSVRLTSQKLNAALGGNIDRLANIIANYYTAVYQLNSKMVVYPAMLDSNRRLIEKASSGATANKISVGELNMAGFESQAEKQIALEIDGFQFTDAPDKILPNEKFHRFYRIWINSKLPGEAAREIQKDRVNTWSLRTQDELDPSFDAIALAIEATLELARQGGKKS